MHLEQYISGITERPSDVYYENVKRLDGFYDGKGKINFSTLWDPNVTAEDVLHSISVRTHHQIAALNGLNEQGRRDHGLFPLYNRHDGPHIEAVSRISLDLLEQSALVTEIAVTEDERKLAILGAYLHDVGNNKSRKDHSRESIHMVNDLFSNLDLSDPKLHALLWSIFYHDEPPGKNISDFSQLPEQLHPYKRAIWALIAADKMDLGRHRISDNLKKLLPQHSQIIADQIIHTRAVLFAENNQFHIDSRPENLGAVYTLNFSTDAQGPPSLEAQATLDLYPMHEGSRTITIPTHWDHALHTSAISYVQSYSHELKVLYLERFGMMTSCIFALFTHPEDYHKSVHELRFVVNDAERDIPVIYTYYRATWKQQMAEEWMKLFPHTPVAPILQP